MKFLLAILFLLASIAPSRAEIAEYSYLGTVSEKDRASLHDLNTKTLLSNDNILEVIVLPTIQWKLSSAGPSSYISRYRKAFTTATRFEKVPRQVSEEVDALKTFGDYPTPNEMIPLVKWSDIYFLLKNGDFLTFGEDNDWIYFRSHHLLGRFKKASEQGAAANP